MTLRSKSIKAVKAYHSRELFEQSEPKVETAVAVTPEPEPFIPIEPQHQLLPLADLPHFKAVPKYRGVYLAFILGAGLISLAAATGHLLIR